MSGNEASQIFQIWRGSQCARNEMWAFGLSVESLWDRGQHAASFLLLKEKMSSTPQNILSQHQHSPEELPQ
eukprot:1157809-Pelagomonas_calceolata.AAC.8